MVACGWRANGANRAVDDDDSKKFERRLLWSPVTSGDRMMGGLSGAILALAVKTALGDAPIIDENTCFDASTYFPGATGRMW